MELKYYRYLEHVGICEDFDAGYRSKKEFMQWYGKDPIKLQRAKLLKLNSGNAYIKKIEDRIEQDINKSIASAKKARFSSPSELYRGVFK
jgi:TPP-dependent pyruvate/acetoin dehydrogenase alpha subunit